MPTMSAVLTRIRRRLSGRSRKAPTFPIERVEVFYLGDDVAALVEKRLISGEPKGGQDGDRSVRLPHPSKDGADIKIKGTGLNLGPVHFGRPHHSGLRSPLFDFDGRMMEDVASGHDAAWLGGASFQQVTTEYRMARVLADKGYDVLPCLGYGRMWHKDMVSWFSVHEPRSDWIGYGLPTFPLEEYVDAMAAQGRLQIELAVAHNLIGYAWWVGKPGGPRVLKDLHAFRHADPINMSQISWTMQLFFCLHVQALSILHYVQRNFPDSAPADVQVVPLRGACPDVTVADHQALRRELVAPYMLHPPERFDTDQLMRVLNSNPITSALLDICPPAFTRY